MSTDNGTLTIDGKKLRLFRERQKLTQLYLATSVEVTTETISRWENNKHPTIKRENAEKLAEVLSIALEQLLKDPPPKPEPEPCPIPASNTDSGQDVIRETSRRDLLAMLGFALLVLAAVAWWWVPAFRPPLLDASRYLPAAVLPGQPFPVVIRIKVKDISVPLMVREHLPEHCRLISALPACMHVGQNGRQLKWVVGTEGAQVHTIVYLVQVETLPLGRQLVLAGNLVTGRRNGGEVPVRGAQATTISPFHWADDNKDHRIDDAELLSVFELFPQGEALGLNLGEIKAIWAGNGYQWDEQQGRLLILGSPENPATGPDLHAPEVHPPFDRSKQP